MIFFVALFILVVTISFILAYLSMKDYKMTPKLSKGEYGLFLIRKSQHLSASVLESIYRQSKKTDVPVSLERSFKNGKSALTIFGPTSMISSLLIPLDLLELEDYTNVSSSKISVWEVGIKKETGEMMRPANMITNLPPISNEEQLWFQLVLKSQKKGNYPQFLCQIRVACLNSDLIRRKNILEQFIKPPFIKIPRPYSNEKLLKFYQDRLLSFDEYTLNLDSAAILKLISLS